MRYAYLGIAVLLTTAFGFIFWFLRAPRVRIETRLYSPAESLIDGAAPSVAIATTADEAMEIIKSEAFLTAIVENPMLFSPNLAIGSDSPGKWLASRLKVGFDVDRQAPAVSVVVAAEHEREGRTLVEGIAHELFSRQLALAARARSDHQSQLEKRFQQLSDEFAKKSSEFAQLENSDVGAAETKKLTDEIDAIDHERAMVLEELQAVDAEAADSLHIRTVTATTVTKLAW